LHSEVAEILLVVGALSLEVAIGSGAAINEGLLIVKDGNELLPGVVGKTDVMVVGVEGGFGSDVVVNVLIAKVHIPCLNDPSVILSSLVPIDTACIEAIFYSGQVVSS
jgi:hypothetical protein